MGITVLPQNCHLFKSRAPIHWKTSYFTPNPVCFLREFKGCVLPRVSAAILFSLPHPGLNSAMGPHLELFKSSYFSSLSPQFCSSSSHLTCPLSLQPNWMLQSSFSPGWWSLSWPHSPIKSVSSLLKMATEQQCPHRPPPKTYWCPSDIRTLKLENLDHMHQS